MFLAAPAHLECDKGSTKAGRGADASAAAPPALAAAAAPTAAPEADTEEAREGGMEDPGEEVEVKGFGPLVGPLGAAPLLLARMWVPLGVVAAGTAGESPAMPLPWRSGERWLCGREGPGACPAGVGGVLRSAEEAQGVMAAEVALEVKREKGRSEEAAGVRPERSGLGRAKAGEAALKTSRLSGCDRAGVAPSGATSRMQSAWGRQEGTAGRERHRGLGATQRSSVQLVWAVRHPRLHEMGVQVRVRPFLTRCY